MYPPERITGQHRTEDFTSGDARLDEWFRRSALTADRKGTARVYVWAGADRIVTGYFAVAPHVIEREAVPRRTARGDPARIPSVLIAKLALDRKLQGRGLGTRLLADALAVVTAAAARAGGRYIVVDAIDDAAAGFYRRHGFAAGPDPSRLVLRVADAAATLRKAAEGG